MAWLLNVIVPGSGLVLRRREWLGLLLALVFAICGNVAIAGVLIAPNAFPRWLVLLGAGLAIACWIFAQYLLWSQGVAVARRRQSAADLLAEARASLARDDREAARRELAAAAELDAENLEVAEVRARLDGSSPDSQNS